MCGQVALGDTRCGRPYLAQELAAVVVSNRGTLGCQPVALSRWISFPLSIHDMLSNWFSRHCIKRHKTWSHCLLNMLSPNKDVQEYLT